jgi:hypothetical protein
LQVTRCVVYPKPETPSPTSICKWRVAWFTLNPKPQALHPFASDALRGFPSPTSICKWRVAWFSLKFKHKTLSATSICEWLVVSLNPQPWIHLQVTRCVV